MKRIIATSLAVMLCTGSGFLMTGSQARADETKATTSAVKPKELTDQVQKGLDYLISKQNADGSWSQGEESSYMRGAGHVNQDVHNVADTCMAAMSVMRAGNFPNSGKYKKNMENAVNYVCSSIEKSDRDSLLITDVTGTRVQTKLGQYVDTFLASVFLPDVKGRMPDPDGNERVATALNKVIYKIEKNQAKNGTWASNGWAPVHSQSLAMQGLNRAKQMGFKVSEEALQAAEMNAKSQFDRRSNSFGGAGSAGVGLYSAGATIGSLQSAYVSNKLDKSKFKSQLSDSRPEIRDQATAELKRIDDTEAAQKQAVDAVANRLGDKGFVAGFGCNGGEEFLSYMQISDTLVANKSKEWPDWDKKITANINHVQNPDGSWMGQHCITSRTFCTAAALLVLMADRGPQLPANIACAEAESVK